jgi:predicted acyl esterase
MASIVVETNVPIPMRDGARLFADIYRPSPSGRYPVLLQRTRQERSSIAAHHGQIRVPALNIGGWYDLFPAGPLDNFAGISKHGATDGLWQRRTDNGYQYAIPGFSRFLVGRRAANAECGTA